MYNIRNGVIRWEIPEILCDAIVMFALSFTIYEIFAIQIKCQKFDLENEGQGYGGEKRELIVEHRAVYNLRSENNNLLVIPRTKSKIASRAFRVSAPTIYRPFFHLHCDTQQPLPASVANSRHTCLATRMVDNRFSKNRRRL